MKIVTLTKEEFDAFARTNKYRNFYQTSNYGELMSNYGFHEHFLGFVNNANRLVGASLVLYKKILFNYKYAYAPHGFLVDYSDPNFLIELADNLKKLLYKQRFIYIKIDPLIHCSERDKNGNLISYNKDINNILEILAKADFVHRGFNQYFETCKPRWNAVIKMTTSSERLYMGFSKQIRNKIRKALKCGVSIYKGTKEDIPTFYKFIEKKHKRPLSYYQKFQELFQDDFEIYFAKIDPQKFVINSREEYEKELERNDRLNAEIQDKSAKGVTIRKLLNTKMQSDRLVDIYKSNMIYATKLLKDYPEGITIGATAIVKYEKEINLLIEGWNPKFSSYNPNYLIKWAILEKYCQEQYLTFNLNAITGEFKKPNKYSGLNESKLGMSASAIEYIGEFDYIINPFIYKICQWRPIRKKINKNTE